MARRPTIQRPVPAWPRSSGSGGLDAAALAMVARAQPFPPFPKDLAEAQLAVTVPISFMEPQ